MKSISLIGLVLHLALHSVYCAETNHDFGKWEKEISAYEASDKTNPPPKGALLFIGSSTVRMWKSLPQDFPNAKVINRGFGGSQIVDSTHFAERVNPERGYADALEERARRVRSRYLFPERPFRKREPTTPSQLRLAI